MTGYRAFSYNFVKTFPILSKGFEIETEMTIHSVSHNMHVANVVTDYRDRPDGSESKLTTYSDGLRVLKTIFRLFKNYRPLLFFGLVSLILFIVGLCFFIPVFTNFMKTGLVPKIPTLVVSCFIMLTAILSLFTGIILDVIVNKDKQAFEFRLQQVHANKVLLEKSDD
jgi:hypothetical protein